MFQWSNAPRETVVPQEHILEALLCPRAGLLKAAGSGEEPVQLVSDSAEGQPWALGEGAPRK
jgi:hypothetical protein